MSDSKIKEFPEITNKLTAPTKKSLFERQKAEAEAKRQREQAETAAVYEDFVKSFDDDGSGHSGLAASLRGGGGRGGGAFAGLGTGASGPPKRHFTISGNRASGPGSLGPAPGNLGRKRAHDGSFAAGREREKDQGLFAYENSASGPVDAVTAFQTSDDEDEKTGNSRGAERVAPKPTLHLSSLPPGTSPAVIKSLLPSTLTVDGVRILPPSAPASTERRSISAIVTLAKDTPASDIDTAVNSLQNRYLGFGFYLTLSRHLSSAALGSASAIPSGLGSAALSSLPFGARPVPQHPGGPLNRAPPFSSHHRGGYAPPSSFAPTGPGQFNRGPQVQVSVHPPTDIRQLKLIHKTLEALLTHGPEFEALLMSRQEVQRDERWAWLWDARSVGGIWYRWRLWDILTRSGDAGSTGRRSNGTVPQRVFDGGALWYEPESRLPFEYTTYFDEFVSDPDYDSSEEEDSGDDAAHRRRDFNHGGGPPLDGLGARADGDEKSYLNPLQKAKLTHLLARLPITTGKLRKGDVTQVTAFAISHAGEGADEVVDMIVSNIERPFALTAANPERRQNGFGKDQDNGASLDEEENGGKDEKEGGEKEDTSSATLIALYVVSDILSSSSTSGVRHAWRYRQLFEVAMRERKIFEKLGSMEKGKGWGRLRAEKWRRSVSGVLTLWEGWCVFPQATWEAFSEGFKNASANLEKEEEARREPTDAEKAAKRSKWKALGAERQRVVDLKVADVEEDVDGEPMVEDEDVDGEPMLEDEDVDGELMVEDDVDGEPMEDGGSAASAEPKSECVRTAERVVLPEPGIEGKNEAARAKRRRPKAEDMFADSDEE